MRGEFSVSLAQKYRVLLVKFDTQTEANRPLDGMAGQSEQRQGPDSVDDFTGLRSHVHFLLYSYSEKESSFYLVMELINEMGCK
jgi:hypothetical protein